MTGACLANFRPDMPGLRLRSARPLTTASDIRGEGCRVFFLPTPCPFRSLALSCLDSVIAGSTCGTGVLLAPPGHAQLIAARMPGLRSSPGRNISFPVG